MITRPASFTAILLSFFYNDVTNIVSPPLLFLRICSAVGALTFVGNSLLERSAFHNATQRPAGGARGIARLSDP